MSISQLNNVMNTRFEELKSKIQSLESQMGIKKKVRLEFCEFNKPCQAFLNKNIVKVSTWFLFKPDDIPPKFRITTTDDPRLVDDSFLNELSDWMNGKLREMGLSSLVCPIDHGALQSRIRSMCDPNLYEKSKDFLLAHEVAHLSHAETEGQLIHSHYIQSSLSLLGIVGGVFLLSLAISIIPFVHLTITLTVIAVAVIVSVSSIFGWMNRQALPVPLSSITEEKKADLDAVKALRDANGGIHHFETTRRHYLAVRRHNIASRQVIDDNGNNLKDKEHPPLAERVAYLRQWQLQFPQRA